MHRFFVPAEWMTGGAVTVSGPLVHQIRRVLRLRAGEHVTFLDNSGWEAEAEIVAIDEQLVRCTVLTRKLGIGEPRTKITLYQSLLKGDRFDLVLQKCTELGVVEFVPVVSERCIVGDVDQASDRFRRWQRIIVEAAEQAQRSRLPVLRPAALLANALEGVISRGLSLVPWEGEHATTLGSALASSIVIPPPAPEKPTSRKRRDVTPQPRRPFAINLFVGPEGGFAPGEIAIARHYGAIPVTLGPRILRAETAGIAAATIVLHEMGDMG